MRRTVVLIILDGWGIGPDNDSNPIHVVKPQNFAWLAENYPLTSLQASGIAVGLPWGEVGNSEVGHLTLGAGKVVYQYYPKITMAVQDGTFFENPVLKQAFDHARENNSGVNLVGLLTKVNTHASLEHIQALLAMAGKEGVSNVKLHLFADGKDSAPHSLGELLAAVPKDKLATLTGRYYAMDRSQNWPLVQKAYDCLTGGGGETAADPKATIDAVYARGMTEEFLPPLRIAPEKSIQENDAVIFFNFREDSMREIAEAFISPEFDKFPTKKFSNLFLATFTRYADKLKAPVAFPADEVEKPLSAILADNQKTQLRLAETYKYAHVTYFFNGHREAPYKGEYRALVPSLNLTHPDEKPELAASAVTDRLLEAIQNQGFDFVLVNYSNPDTIAHTGKYDACLEAVRVMDRELGRILKATLNTPTVLLITSDHGNIEEILNPKTGEPETQHDSSPVPLYLVSPELKGRKFANWRDIRNQTMGILSDVAPTILALMELPQPPEMNGRNLLRDLL